MGTLKESIRHYAHLLETISLYNYFKVARKVESINMATRRTTFNNYQEINDPSLNLTESTSLTPQ